MGPADERARPVLRARPADPAKLAAALAAEALPHADLEGPGKSFFAFEDERGELVGYGGLEVRGADALLRSLLTLRRGHGFGRLIVERLIAEAKGRGVKRLYLLTLTAASFFAHLGFTPTARDAVPRAIAETEEFRSLCPKSAACFLLDLR